MPAATTDLFLSVGNPGSATNLAGSGYTAGATSITVTSTTNWPTDSLVIFGIDTVETDSNGEEVRVDGSYCVFEGIVTSATTIGSVTKLFGDSQDYAAGATTRVYITVSTKQNAKLIEGLLVSHERDGTLKSDAVQDALGISGGAGDGWSILNAGTAPTVSTGYNKGNKEYDLTFAGVDLTTVLSPGMRMKLTRGTTAPTQCMDLESGSSQYASKSSPSGISFTDDFTVEAWVKLESYGTTQMDIVSRFSSTGWLFYVKDSGQLGIYGQGASTRGFLTYQSLPLNQWVHVAATLDMSAGTATTYINGVSVPNATSFLSGTSLTQAGNLNIGSENGSSSFFDGKIVDVRVWSAIRTATQIRDNMNQQLVGNETNLVAYFKLNGNLNDSTSNANNLTGSGGAVATSVDNPMEDTEYALVTKVTSSQVTVFTGTDHNIPNMTLSNPYYSTQKAPFGFPTARGKWRVETNCAAGYNSAATPSGFQYTNFVISVPTGDWVLGYNTVDTAARGVAGVLGVSTTLSTTNNSENNPEFSSFSYVSSAADMLVAHSKYLPVSVATATPYYLGLTPENNAAYTSVGIAPGLSIARRGISYISAESAYI